MTRISDETLMAYADGELAELDAEVVRAAVEGDPELCERLGRLQRVDELLRAAFPAPLDEPERLTELLQAPMLPPTVRLASRSSTHRWIPAGAAVAAGFVGLIVGNVLFATRPGLIDLSDGVDGAGIAQEALSNLASGDSTYEYGVKIEPVVSFVANDGRRCRDVKIDAQGTAARFVACRSVNDSAWRIEAFAREPRQAEMQGYRQAGGGSNAVIDATIRELGVKATLDASQERIAIESGW